MAVVPVEIRGALADDADAIAAVHIAAWRETYAELLPDRFFDGAALETRRRMWNGILALDPVPGKVVVAEREGHVVGFAFAGPAWHPDARRGFEPASDLHLFSIYLLAAEQGRGAGSALLEAAIGGRSAQLWVASANEHARHFYERHGFRMDGGRVEDADLEGMTEVRMVR